MNRETPEEAIAGDAWIFALRYRRAGRSASETLDQLLVRWPALPPAEIELISRRAGEVPQ